MKAVSSLRNIRKGLNKSRTVTIHHCSREQQELKPYQQPHEKRIYFLLLFIVQYIYQLDNIFVP